MTGVVSTALANTRVMSAEQRLLRAWSDQLAAALAGRSTPHALLACADLSEEFARTEPALFRALVGASQSSAPANPASDELARLSRAAARKLDEHFTRARPTAAGDHFIQMWTEALHEAYVSAETTPQERIRARTALRELRSYAGVLT